MRFCGSAAVQHRAGHTTYGMSPLWQGTNRYLEVQVSFRQSVCLNTDGTRRLVIRLSMHGCGQLIRSSFYGLVESVTIGMFYIW
jgi:hypothetical protein